MGLKFKQICAILIACCMMCNIFSTNTLAKEEQPVYSNDLRLISYADLDQLRQWDDELGIFEENRQADLKTYVENNITKGAADDYEKANRIFDWIYENVTYASDYSMTAYINPWDVFTYKTAVCGGFSNLYKAMLNSIGIPAVLVAGNSLYGAHVWNAVYANEKWFYSDSTWGTSDLGDFFDIGTNKFLDSHTPLKVQALSLETEEGVLIGYDNGIAVVGVTKGQTTVVVPDTYKEMYVSSIAHDFFSEKYGVKIVYVGSNIYEITTQMSSNTLEAFIVDEENYSYASRDGVLFSKDMSRLLVYPAGKNSDTFVLPKETVSFDLKDVFSNAYLKNIEVETGNVSYASYEGALYNADKTKLLMIPAGMSDVYVWDNATIDDMALANVDRNCITIHGKEGSPAQQFAEWYQIPFKCVTDCKCEKTEEVINKATPEKDGQIVTKCSNCGSVKNTEIIAAVSEIELSQNEFLYDGTNKMPQVVVKDREGTCLQNGFYDVNFAEECKNPGTYSVLVTLKGEYYSGTLTAEYIIKGGQNPFVDVKEGAYFYDAVLWASEKSITSGTTATTFEPDSICTRGQVVTFLWREQGCPEPKGTKNPFADVKEDEYYYKAVLWAAEEGIAKGTSAEYFSPNETVTRGQFVLFLHRASGTPGYTVKNQFKDVKTDDYYYDAVLWAYENGITTGYQENAFAPELGCSRCQVVTFLYRNK